LARALLSVAIELQQ